MGRLFFDSANLNDIEKIVRTSAFCGVTTNPSLVALENDWKLKRQAELAARENVSNKDLIQGTVESQYLSYLRDVLKAMRSSSVPKMHLSVEVTTTDPGKMVEQAQEIFEKLKETCDVWDINLHVKIPVLFDTLRVITKLVKQNIRVNATACMTFEQAKVAEAAGADVISFFYNRMIDTPMTVDVARGEITKFATVKDQKTKIICGSIRKPIDVNNCWTAGADIVTLSLKVFKEMIVHPKTDEAVRQFQEDVDKWLA